MVTNKFFYTLSALVTVILLVSPVITTDVRAALLEGSDEGDVLIGNDDDNMDNPVIQPPDTEANQSLDNTDILLGSGGDDVLIGLLGNDVLNGGSGNDILIGGTEQFIAPNKDIIFGGSENDINIWAPGDGSDAFLGGPGQSDAQVFGVIDREERIVPILSRVPHSSAKDSQVKNGRLLPTAEVTNSPGFCRLERVEEDQIIDDQINDEQIEGDRIEGTGLGYEFLVRFFVRETGNLAVTIRLAEVEQVFCTSEEGGAITFADLTEQDPQFVEISLEEAKALNPTVALIIR